MTSPLQTLLRRAVGVSASIASSSSVSDQSDVLDQGSAAAALLNIAKISPEDVERYLSSDVEAKQLIGTALGPHPKDGRWKPTSAQSETQFRTLSLLSSLAQLREAYQDLCNEHWNLGDRIRSFIEDDSDPLARMAALSLVQELGSTTWGLRLLTANGTLGQLDQLLADPLLTGQALSTVCALLQVQPQLQLPASLVRVVEQELESGSSNFGLALVAVGLIAAGPQAHLVLDNSLLMDRYAQLCSTSRVAATSELFLNSLNVHLLVSNVSPALFDSLSSRADETPLRLALTIASRRGQAELRMLALNLLSNLVKHEWGASLLIEFPGFFDFIIDRGTEVSHDGLHIKYEILRTLVGKHRQLCEDFYEVSEMDTLQRYLVDGAVFVPRKPATVLVADDTN